MTAGQRPRARRERSPLSRTHPELYARLLRFQGRLPSSRSTGGAVAGVGALLATLAVIWIADRVTVDPFSAEVYVAGLVAALLITWGAFSFRFRRARKEIEGELHEVVVSSGLGFDRLLGDLAGDSQVDVVAIALARLPAANEEPIRAETPFVRAPSAPCARIRDAAPELLGALVRLGARLRAAGALEGRNWIVALLILAQAVVQLWLPVQFLPLWLVAPALAICLVTSTLAYFRLRPTLHRELERAGYSRREARRALADLDVAGEIRFFLFAEDAWAQVWDRKHSTGEELEA